MRNLFLDTNVVLDILCQRQSFYEQSEYLLEQVKEGEAQFFIASASLANLLYFIYEYYDLPDATKSLADFLETCILIHTDEQTLKHALRCSFKDKEDALQYYTALSGHDIDYFITRNKDDYGKSIARLPVMLPAEFKNILR